MAIGTAATRFGRRAAEAKAQDGAKEVKKAQLWLNIGYEVEVEENGELVKKFISLPVGLPLDQIEKLKISGRNEDFNDLQRARNALLDELLEGAKEIKAGEALTLDGAEFTVQIRRVNEEVAQESTGTNKYARK